MSSDFGASIWMVYPGFVLYYSDIINTENSYSFDLLYKGLEITSGGLREHRYENRVNNIKEKGEPDMTTVTTTKG